MQNFNEASPSEHHFGRRGLLVKMLIILEPRMVSFDQVVHPYTF